METLILKEIGDGRLNMFKQSGNASKKKTYRFYYRIRKVYSLKNFVDEVFKILKIKKENLIYNVSALKRNTDIQGYKADIKRTKKS